MVRFTENIIMQLTKDCNMHCTYCYQGKKIGWKGKQVNLETFKQLVDTVLYYRCILGNINNRIDFHFHGGEVTLIPEETLKQMINYVLQRKTFFPGISFCMQTNGTMLTESLCSYFKEVNLSPGVSFDGFHSEERMSIENTKKWIKHLKDLSEKTGCQFGILSVLSNSNIKTWFSDMEKVREEASKMNPNPIINIGVNPIVCEDDSLIPSPEDQWEYWIKPVLESYLTDNPFRERNVEIAIEKVLTDIIFENDKKSTLKTGCFDRICGHGANMIAVDPNLNLYNCDKYLEEGPFINLRKGVPINQRDFLGLQQIKRCIKYYQEIFKLENKHHCDLCKARWMCPGDCQAAVFSKYGEYRLNSDMCAIYKRAYDFISDNWIKIAANEFKIVGQVFNIRTTALSELEKYNKKVEVDTQTGKYKVVNK